MAFPFLLGLISCIISFTKITFLALAFQKCNFSKLRANDVNYTLMHTDKLLIRVKTLANVVKQKRYDPLPDQKHILDYELSLCKSI